jgi:hypothetical protein
VLFQSSSFLLIGKIPFPYVSICITVLIWS